MKQSGLVVFHGEVMVGFSLSDQVVGDFALGQQVVGGDVLSLDIDGVKQGDCGFYHDASPSIARDFSRHVLSLGRWASSVRFSGMMYTNAAGVSNHFYRFLFVLSIWKNFLLTNNFLKNMVQIKFAFGNLMGFMPGGFVEKGKLDALDNGIIRLLTEDGRMPIGELAAKLDVTAPTVRNRIKCLEKDGIFKVSGLIDPSVHREMITALVGMNVQSGGKIEQVLGNIANLPNVAWAGVVTGRYDIIAEVICVGGKDELYRFTTQTILKIGNVVKSETFILMRSKNNWLQLPTGVAEI